MTSKTKFTALLTAGSLLLPLGLAAQSGTSTGSNASTRSTTGQGQGQYQGANPDSGSTQRPSTDYDRGNTHASSMQSQDIKRVSADKLKDKITADRLTGKTVVDRDGQRIGQVKHVGIGQTLRNSDRQRSPGAGSMNVAGSGSASTAGSLTGMSSASAGGQVDLYIELDEAVGVDGGDLASVPASSARFDQGSDELKLQVGREEFATQLRQSTQSSSVSE